MYTSGLCTHAKYLEQSCEGENSTLPPSLPPSQTPAQSLGFSQPSLALFWLPHKKPEMTSLW